jgi:hypothetical protein
MVDVLGTNWNQVKREQIEMWKIVESVRAERL